VVKMPWAEPSSRFTALFEALAIEWLKAASQKAVAGLLRLSWDEIHGIMERAVERGLARREAEPVTQIGVDEKAFRKGQNYLTLVNDLLRGRVLYVAEERKQSSLDGFWKTLTAEQIAASRPSPWICGTPTWLRCGRMCRTRIARSFSTSSTWPNIWVMPWTGCGARKTRVLKAAGDDRLAGTRYDWLRNPTSMDPRDRREFAALRTAN
jgi:transposase